MPEIIKNLNKNYRKTTLKKGKYLSKKQKPITSSIFIYNCTCSLGLMVKLDLKKLLLS